MKVRSWCFQQCFGLFNILTVKGCSEMGLFRHLSNHVFRSCNFLKYISYDGHLFFQNVQSLIYISEMKQKMQKKFFVLNIIAFELVAKNDLLRRGYFSSAVNVLTNRHKISGITKTNIFQRSFPESNERIWWKCCGAVFRTV